MKCPTMDQPLSQCPHCGRPPISHRPDGECVPAEHWARQAEMVRLAALGDPGELDEAAHLSALDDPRGERDGY